MEDDQTQDKFRRNLLDIRTEKGLTQKELSELTGINRTYISDIERGKSVPSIIIAEKLSDGLGCNIEELFL